MLELLAPAKLNLGLEVIRKRDDGYHDLTTMFCAVSLFDKIRIHRSATDALVVSDPALRDGNLILRALDLWDAAGLNRPALEIILRKRIPAAAGLGGASSDAAAVIRALAESSDFGTGAPEVTSLAARLGSDVPYFLRGGRAIGEGRGDLLRPLPYIRLAAVIITPALEIADKTRSMYAALGPDDFSDGSRLQRLIEEPYLIFDRRDASMPNAFERPLYAFYPELASVAAAIRVATGQIPSVSGAGPSLYLLARTLREAHDMRRIVAGLNLAVPCALFCVRAIRSNAGFAKRRG
ncbi:MAG: 4-(cytidine 5'-diphospho)-2-C-methyl-D-erythritol kinase [Chloroflexota bacterium]|nr:4-(cytidine 5'-diphospho)-2-C-methyl-D-erythritol kinase [Chloroflexota bacterium]